MLTILGRCLTILGRCLINLRDLMFFKIVIEVTLSESQNYNKDKLEPKRIKSDLHLNTLAFYTQILLSSILIVFEMNART